MKKKVFCLFAVLALCAASVCAQTHVSVHIDDDIYMLIEHAQMLGLCSPLSGARPYSEQTIKRAVNEILSAEEESDGTSALKPAEIDILKQAAEKFERKAGFDWQRGGWYFPQSGGVPISMDLTAKLDSFISAGIYSDDKQFGGYFKPMFSAAGDLGSSLSFDLSLFGVAVRSVLSYWNGSYEIGKFWYDTNKPTKTIKTYRNRAFFPFTFTKPWDGVVYKSGAMDADGLEDWCDGLAFGFGMTGEFTYSALQNRIQIRLGRINREWAAMDNGASLVVNSRAKPFLAFEAEARLFKWLNIATMTGILEAPLSGHVYGDTYKYELYESSYGVTAYDPSAMFQNAYSVAMIEADFKYLHVDGGTTCVWPKRFELGYMFPLVNMVFYQNQVGDFDNLALFGNIRVQYPGFGRVWFSSYFDEMNGFSTATGMLSGKIFNATRDMFALQAGLKVNVPFLPFASFSARYTKIEPYCYTHHSINYTPWYFGQYVSEACMNHGEPVGYYMPPNSDEFNFLFETMPMPNFRAHAQYQFARCGADHGSQAVRGSSLYSELDNEGRDDMKKYFLHDGAYQWFHVVKLGASYSFRKFRIPLTLYGEIGYVYSYYTVLEDDAYANDNSEHDYTRADSDDPQYGTEKGFIASFGVKLFI
ncbi:MAG: hypothetical protein NC041_04875 [Bacteroides sp.]|nr:hypothetical protein [Prevotella sp.]MCM1407293.1 hypothetical protein [Treponema brennaborense]MCM1469781.1 hypothetical protein [Bacteroides sp.]